MIDPEEVRLVRIGIDRYGGSFMSALGEALRLADIHNQTKIKSTWPSEWEQYHQMGRRIEENERVEAERNKTKEI